MTALQAQQIVRWSDIPMRNGQLAQPAGPARPASDDITSSTVPNVRKRMSDKKASLRAEDASAGRR